jgi:hypothetical protein
MNRRRTRLVLTLTLPALLWWGSGHAHATAATTGTPCTFAFDVTVSPGLSSTAKSSGTFTSNGQTGTITCNGTVNGKQPTGAGTFGTSGRYGTKNGGDTCQSGGNGDGVDNITVPTASGNQSVTSHFTFVYGALKGGGLISGTFTGDRFSGTFDVQLTQGDCVTKPFTKGHVTGKGMLT